MEKFNGTEIIDSGFTDHPKQDGSKVEQKFVIFSDCSSVSHGDISKALYSLGWFLVFSFSLFFFYFAGHFHMWDKTGRNEERMLR